MSGVTLSEIDVKMKKNLDQVFDKTEACFCCLKSLSSNDIYGTWNGIPWLCQHENKPRPPLNIEELMTKIQKPSCSKQWWLFLELMNQNFLPCKEYISVLLFLNTLAPTINKTSILTTLYNWLSVVQSVLLRFDDFYGTKG